MHRMFCRHRLEENANLLNEDTRRCRYVKAPVIYGLLLGVSLLLTANAMHKIRLVIVEDEEDVAIIDLLTIGVSLATALIAIGGLIVSRTSTSIRDVEIEEPVETLTI